MRKFCAIYITTFFCTILSTAWSAGSSRNIVFEKAVTFTANGNFTVPAGVFQLRAEGIGGGGGGGAGAGTVGGGGGGGGAGEYGIITMTVTPGAVLPVVIGAAGTGAPQSGLSADGANGTAGGNTTFNGFTWHGGDFGEGGKRNPNVGGPGGNLTDHNPLRDSAGGTGSTTQTGASGESTPNFAGGAGGGTLSGGQAGGGGGGGASVWGAGGAGGVGAAGGGGNGSAGASAVGANNGTGGGGGGGGESAGATRGGAGGNGTTGRMVIRYLSAGQTGTL